MPTHHSNVKSLVIAALLALAIGEMTLQLFAVPIARASRVAGAEGADVKPATVPIALPPPLPPLPVSGGDSSFEDIGPGMAEPLLVGSPDPRPAATRGSKSRGVR